MPDFFFTSHLCCWGQGWQSDCKACFQLHAALPLGPDLPQPFFHSIHRRRGLPAHLTLCFSHSCSYLFLFLPFLTDFICLCMLIFLNWFLVEALQVWQLDQDLLLVVCFIRARIVHQHQGLQHGEHLQFCHFLQATDPIVPKEKSAQCAGERDPYKS